MVRRVCFDIGSNYYWSSLKGFLNEPSQSRACFQDKKLKFHAATTFDSYTRKFTDFTDPKSLLDHLQSAEEIITFNGRTCDLIVLEKILGEEALASVWNKPHHDLRGWKGFSLADSVKSALPNKVGLFESTERKRLSTLLKGTCDEFIRGHLANTYRDTKFTYALFLEYLKTGSREYTFRDS